MNRHTSLAQKSLAILISSTMLLVACRTAPTPPPTTAPAVTSVAGGTAVPATPAAPPTRVIVGGPSPTPAPVPTTLPPLPTRIPSLNLDFKPIDADQPSARIIQFTPERNQKIAANGAVEIVFDRPMDQQSVAKALVTSPKVEGAVSWTSPHSMRFKPAGNLPPVGGFALGLSQDAKGADGAPLREPFEIQVAAQGSLEVTQTIPDRDAAEVQPDTIVTVMFNRPVIPLGSVAQTAEFLNKNTAISFDPPLAGKAEWLNTSVLVFKPEKPLPGGQRFTGKIAGTLQDTDGALMAGDYTWQFSTSAPKVLMVNPNDNPTPNTPPAIGVRRPAPNPAQNKARVDSVVTVQFNQSVNAESAKAALTLTNAKGEKIDGTAVVLSETLTFTPSKRLDFDGVYTVKLAAGVLSASGGVGGKEAWESKFSTFPLPRLLSTNPTNGTNNAPAFTSFTMRFNAPIDPASVMARVTMTPPFSPTKVFTYYSEFDNSFTLNFGPKPATDYTVVIAPGITDPFGNSIAESTTVKFRTGNLSPNANILLPGNLGTFDANAPVRVAVQSNNINTLKLSLHPIVLRERDLNDWFNSESGLPARIERSWTETIGGPANQQKRTTITVGAGDGKLKPGAYLLVLDSPDFPNDANRKYRQQRVVLIVSEINLVMKREATNVLVWATDLRTGSPVSGLSVEAFNLIYERAGRKTVSLGSASTNADGIAKIASKAESRYAQGFAISGEGPGVEGSAASSRFAYVSSNWDGDGFPIDFSGRYWSNDDDVGAQFGAGVRGFIYSERAIYRPGQKVYLKGLLRREDDVRYSLLPAGQRVQIDVNNPRGETVLRKEVKTDEMGGVDIEVALAETAATGAYRVSMILTSPQPGAGNEGDVGPNVVGTASFTVAAYRPPEYEVTVSPAAKQAVRGSTLTSTVEAKYLSGGGLANTPIAWNVLATRSSFDPPQLGEYSFADNDSAIVYDWWKPRVTEQPLPILRGNGTTDQRGQFALSVPISTEINLPKAGDSRPEPVFGTLKFSIEANATGADNQQIAGRSQVTIHPAQYYVGVASAKNVIEVKKPSEMRFVVVDWDGKRQANRAISVDIVRREWKSEFDTATQRWKSEVIDETVGNASLTSDTKGEAKYEFSATKSGTYRIVAKTRDDNGRSQQSVRSVWVSGSDYVPWFRNNDDRIGLVANQSSYVPGDTAEVLIPSPFEGQHLALVTVERGHVLKHDVVKITSNSQIYRVPIVADYAPNVYVSVVLIKSSSAGAATAAAMNTSLKDTYKLGSVELPVKPVPQILNVTLSADTKLAQPGQTINYTLQINDSTGKPVSGVFSLDLVDKGILNLRPRTANAINSAFYGRRGLGVQTALGLAVSGNRYVDEGEMGGRGGGGGGDVAEKAIDAVVMAAPVAAAAPAPAGARALGNAPAAPEVSVRENFADTGFWQANVKTDAQGKASVAIKLPDNLTTWVLRAVGADKETRVGEGLADVVATKPVLIRPVTPRFMVVGDVVELSAIINNNTAEKVSAVASLRESRGISLTSAAEQPISLEPNSEGVVRWSGKVQDLPQADLVFQVKSDKYADAARPRLSTAPNNGIKINRYSTAEVVGTAGQMLSNGSRSELIALPPNLDASQGSLTVRLDPSLVAAIQPGLRYLDGYSYESAEAVMSSFLPNALTLALLKEFKQADANLQRDLQANVTEGLDKLYRSQHADGGWGWYKEAESNSQTTLYVLFGLLRAKEAGFAVRQDVVERALVYITPLVRDAKTLRSTADLNQLAYVAFVQAESKRVQASTLDNLYDQRDRLGIYAKALLALSIGKQNATDARLKTLFADLNAKVVQSATGSHWEEDQPDWFAMNSDTRSTALVLMALARYDAKNNLAPNATRWLMSERNANGYWRSTYESAWVLMALTDWARATGELKANYEYGASLNGKEIVKTKADSSATDKPLEGSTTQIAVGELIRESANRLIVARGAGDGRLYYSAHLQAYLPVPDVKAMDRGIQVRRRYMAADCTEGLKCPEIKQGKVGEVLRVEVSLISPNNLYYVQLEDALPAGAELVDSALATSSQLATKDTGFRISPAASGPASPYWRWWNWYSRSELRDDRIALFARYLPKGSYDYSYTIRLTTPGQFNVIPTFANQQYFPEVFGRGDGALFTVTK